MRRGFTLIELIVVVIIIGILATVAIPQFIKVVERAKGGKARHALGLIAGAEKMYRADTDYYRNVNDGAFNATLGNWTELTEVDADLDWNYAVSGSSATAFLVTATRTQGANTGETVTLNQNGVWAGNFVP